MSVFLTRFFGAISILIQLVFFVWGILGTGCAIGARVNLSAADALDGISLELNKSLAEYHADLGQYDDDRERAALSAFIARVQAGNGDATQSATSAADLLAAMQKIRVDRDVETQRYLNSRENAASLAEVSTGLRQFAIQASSLDDEAKRYFGEFIKKSATKVTQSTESSSRKSSASSSRAAVSPLSIVSPLEKQ